MTLDAADLAARSGTTSERIAELTRRGVLQATADGRYELGDVHRIRAVNGFEAAGVPLDALVAAQEQGRISFAYYDQLHLPPGPASSRRYGAFRESLGPERRWLAALWTAFGLAEPEPHSRLEAAEEELLGDLARTVDATGQGEMAIRAVRLFGEANRRAADAALGVYSEVVDRVDEDLAGLPSDEAYESVFVPWARMARSLPIIAGWLGRQHMSQAIDAYSVEATEGVLEASGHLPERPSAQPAVAFVDLSGFARLAEERGDEAAAATAMRLGEVAAEVTAARGGRVVKLLGDGVLMHFADAAGAVMTTLAVLDRLATAGLPPGHAGVHAGPVVSRDGDVYGRTVNLASRIGDSAAAGELLVSREVVAMLPDGFESEAMGQAQLHGIGPVEVFRVRPVPTRP